MHTSVKTKRPVVPEWLTYACAGPQCSYSERKSVYAPHANLCVLPCQQDSSWEAWLRNRGKAKGSILIVLVLAVFIIFGCFSALLFFFIFLAHCQHLQQVVVGELASLSLEPCFAALRILQTLGIRLALLADGLLLFLQRSD